MTASPRVALLAAVSLLLTAAASCAKEEFAVLDLASDLHLAEFQRDTGVVDLGEPGARHVLMDGWFRSDRQWLDEEVRFVWGTGDRSRLRVWSFRDGARRLRLTGRPLVDARGTPEVEVVLNGRRVDRFAMQEGWNEYDVTLPEGALQRGGNELELHYHWGRAAPAGADTLRSVAWDRLRMGKPWVYGEPRADVLADGDAALVLPFFSQLDYYVRLRPGQALRFGPVAVQGDQVRADGAALEVTVETEQGVLLETAISAADFAGTQSIAVPVQEPAVGRVSLRARIDNDPQRESGLRIAAPRLVGIEGPVAVAAGEPPRWTAAERRPNVLIYLVDTLRADHLGVYGYDKDTSPSIDAFAGDAVTFDRAYAQSGWTRSSVASIFTGMVPIAHGVLDRKDSMPEEAPLISRLFGELGYQTLGITTNGNVSKYFDFERVPRRCMRAFSAGWTTPTRSGRSSPTCIRAIRTGPTRPARPSTRDSPHLVIPRSCSRTRSPRRWRATPR